MICLDVVGTLTNQIHSGTQRGYVDGVHRGDMQQGMRRGYVEGVHRRGTWSRYAEGVSLFVHSYHWLPLATIDLVGDNREFEV